MRNGNKPWHGAAPTAALTHAAIQEQLDGKAVDWMEKVSDEQYRKRGLKRRSGLRVYFRAGSGSVNDSCRKHERPDKTSLPCAIHIPADGCARHYCKPRR